MADFDNIINFTLAAEGGLSNDPDDNAAKYPSPYFFLGKNNYHTNKGITYKTFEAAAKLLDIENNFTNFIVMPKNVWAKIAKNVFWDRLNLDKLNNQAIANLLFSWFWGSGYNFRNRIKKYLSSNNIDWNINEVKKLPSLLNILIKKKGANSVYNSIEQTYKQYLISLNQNKFIKGWLKRLQDLKEINLNYLSSKKNILIPVSIVLFLGYLYSKK